MPQRISLQSRKRLIKMYFEGQPQTSIADRIGVSQSTVSNEVKRFIGVARSSSLEEALRMYDVAELVEELRALSVELARIGRSPRECLEAAKAMESIKEAGLDASDIPAFLRLCKRFQGRGSPSLEDFLKCAVKLSKLEEEMGRSYGQILKDFEEKGRLSKDLEEHIRKLRSDIKKLEETRSSLQKQLRELEEGVRRRMEEANLTYERIELALRIEDLMRRMGVSAESLANFLGEVYALNYDLDTVVKILRDLRGLGGR